MFTTPEMRVLIEQVDAILALYEGIPFPIYAPEHQERLDELSCAYWAARERAGLGH